VDLWITTRSLAGFAIFLFLCPQMVWGQENASPDFPDSRSSPLLESRSVQNAPLGLPTCEAENALAPTTELGACPSSDAPPPARGFGPVRLCDTWLAGGGNRGLGINDVETSVSIPVSFADSWAPLVLTPGAAWHAWQGPNSVAFPGQPDLPGSTYDVYLDVGWRPQLARWLFADLGVMPGLYSDFQQVSWQSFRPHARALAIVAFSADLQVVAGVLYVNRIHVQLLPAGGVLWSPCKDVHCELVFPQPKIAYRLTALGLPAWSVYLMGEFGGDTWTIQRADGAADLADYRDQRLIAGVQWDAPGGISGRLESGYVFNRALQYTSATPGLKPDDTVMVRAGISY
jgi:hypothetical protein